ncbi:hypothetical protein [Nocardia sp. NPDC050175]|uniref:hypothetical protein n=1 Tax=Nocardia sp. NPDC050175 TaxID=3364317 RepID=UPI0037AB28EF
MMTNRTLGRIACTGTTLVVTVAAMFMTATPASAAQTASVTSIDKVTEKDGNLVVDITYNCDASSEVKTIAVQVSDPGIQGGEVGEVETICNGSSEHAAIPVEMSRSAGTKVDAFVLMRNAKHKIVVRKRSKGVTIQ